MGQVSGKRTLLVVFDGLRPDYINRENMPNTLRLMEQGIMATSHLSVYPTLTRVNSAAVASGAYPETNGIMGNSVYFPSVDSVKALNSGDARDLMKIVDQQQGRLYTVPTLGEVLHEQGKQLMVFSTGSTGQSFLLHHTADKHNGAIINPELILPAGFQQGLEKEVGPVPESAKENMGRHSYIADAYIRFGLLADNAPEVSIIWFTDPDATAHAYGVGAEETFASIKFVDNELGRILKAIKMAGLLDSIDILLTTDHGFVTHLGKTGLDAFLTKTGFKKEGPSASLVVAGGAIYVKDKKLIPAMVAALQKEEWVGALFTRQGNNGQVGEKQGTLSLDDVFYNHPERSPDILVDMAWNDSVNEFGFAGMSHSHGIAGHGCSSPYEMKTWLVAQGPSFPKGAKSEIPSGNVDLAPTILHLQNIAVPETMDGRVLLELFKSGEKNHDAVNVDIKEAYTEGYQLELHTVSTGKSRYLLFTRVRR